MSGTSRLWIAVAFVLALLPAGAVQAQDDQCPTGAVNTITGNYTGVSDPAQDPGVDPTGARCEICLFVRVQTGEFAWEDVAKVCDIWSAAQAYEVMYKIGRCGLVVPSFETAGVFYGASVPIRAEAVRVDPCAVTPDAR